MYKIYADDTLIYDSTLENYKIVKGTITREINKAGSFTFSIYPDHFYYDKFIRLKTVITVYKSGKIVFRGRLLNDTTDHWNNKTLTCEGELGFLQDSIIRPFTFDGQAMPLFKKFINEHNSAVDDFKKFNIGECNIIKFQYDRGNSNYESTLSNLNSRLINSSAGGYFYITHGDDGTDPIPTIHYLKDFTKVSSQTIEFGLNLKNYTKTVKGDEIATAIIPLGHEVDDGNDKTVNPKLTIESVNDGKDYVYSEEGVALYGWIFKTVSWDDVTVASNLKRNAEDYLEESVKQNITIELNAIDLHLLDRSIESFNVCDYVRVISPPHNFDATLLCNKQTLDLLKPENDSIVLGYNYSTFTESSHKVKNSIAVLGSMQSTVNNLSNRVDNVTQSATNADQNASTALNNYQQVSDDLDGLTGDLEIVAGAVTDNARNISTNASNIATNASNIATNASEIETLKTDLETVAGVVTENARNISTNSDNIARHNSFISTLESEIANLKVLISNMETRLQNLENSDNTGS